MKTDSLVTIDGNREKKDILEIHSFCFLKVLLIQFLKHVENYHLILEIIYIQKKKVRIRRIRLIKNIIFI